MKTLLVMRHAKSGPAQHGMEDHARPLNERGRQDAPQMGRFLAQQGLRPGVVISSTAKRARKTAELVAKALEFTGTIEATE
ncbi:MAG: histidine phosphatase family protein, partial [Candidatus Hydrogenedentota bacterium]